MSSLTISRLNSGGLMTNYYCTSRCAHCLYNCSPGWPRDYIGADEAAECFSVMKRMGCRSAHIGGGEPLLAPEKLIEVLRAARREKMQIEYVETNSSWFRDIESCIQTLNDLKREGLSMLLVSISPFHNEHIPFHKVKGVMEGAGKTGIQIFPWIMEFFEEINAFDDRSPHPLSEYERQYGKGYVQLIPRKYWVNLGGRALDTYSRAYPIDTPKKLLEQSRGGCIELGNTNHFHIDLFGGYIPGLCSGLSIRKEDLGSPLSREKYPWLSALHSGGVTELFSLASVKFGYASERDYIVKRHFISKCHLCSDIRRFLVIDSKVESPDLAPLHFYREMSPTSP